MNSFRFNAFRDQAIKIFWITFAWTFVSVFQFLTGYSTVQMLGCDLQNFEVSVFIRGSTLTGVLAGIIGGSVLVLVWEKWLRNKNYGTALLNIFASYILIYLIVSTCTGLFMKTNELGLPFSDPLVLEAVRNEIFRLESLRNFIFWLLIVIGTLVFLLVNDKYGPGVLKSFLLGKYFQPKREERIFMFLDLRSSTSIAEKLGEVRYFNFIKDVFKDATPAILHSKGEIYQYVGDEIIVSWKMKNGIKDANCLQCFFEVQLALSQRKEYYRKNYDNIIPEFKAGVHYGNVMAGEVGVVKRDIAFSGDVLNTTARIQSKCNELGVNILFSKFLMEKLNLRPNLFTPQKMGDIGLRGKQEKVVLYTV